MLADMKEKQAYSDHDREQTTLDREKVAHEQEALKQLNDQLLAQIVTLQRAQEQTQPESEPVIGKA